MERIAIYPGTFDPITNGHIDVIERASAMFDKVILLLAVNSKKKNLFNDEKRLYMAEEALKHLKNVDVDIHKGLIVDYCSAVKARTIIRGIRAISDFEYEFQIALMNKKINPDTDTIFLLPDEKYTYLNSSIIRELAAYGRDLSEFVPPVVMNMLKEVYQDKYAVE